MGNPIEQKYDYDCYTITLIIKNDKIYDILFEHTSARS